MATLLNREQTSSEVVTVTPELAAQWLATSRGNRTISKTRVSRYKNAMLAGRWWMTGEPVSFDRDGSLHQGHHRLLACIEAGVPFQTLVVKGVEPEAFLLTDSGKPWNFADHLSAKGEKNNRELASTVLWVYRYLHGDLRYAMHAPTADILFELLDEHPGIRDVLHPGRQIREKTGLSQPIASGAMYIAQGIDAEDADAFFTSLATGANLAPGSPVLALRNWVANARMRTNYRAQPRMISAVTIKAWNFFRAGLEIEQLRWRAGGAAPEAFPAMM